MQLEAKLTESVVQFIRYKYPKIVFFHVPNESKSKVQYYVKLKRMGVRSGVSDLLFLNKSKIYDGLALELKWGKNKLSESQIAFLKDVQAINWATGVAYSFDEAHGIIDKYFNNEQIFNKYI